MSDYTQITTFTAKDALVTGNPAKRVKGSEIDPELAAIAAAILTKYDSGDIASNAQAAAFASDAVLITPIKLLYALQNGSHGLLASASYTAADVLTKLLTVDGSGSGLDADLLDGQSSAYYQSASNLNAGTVPDARFPATLPALNGSALTNLNGSAVASGTVAKAYIDADVYRGTLGSANISAQSGGSPSGGSNGDIILIY